MTRLADRWSDGNLVITQRMADVLGIPGEKLWGIWPSGVDVDLFTGAWDNRRWPAPGELVQLIYIGSLNYERNLMAMSKAVMMANREGMQLKLKLVGGGTGEGDLKTFADTTSGLVEVEASMSHSTVPHLLTGAHVGVLPFPDEEKFRVSSPIKLFEYMAAGLPILATRIVCHTDVMDESRGVFWADGSDEEALLLALQNLWHARDELSWRGKQSLDLAQEWTWANSARKLKAALETGLARYPVSESGE
jgi:glycosyltransferase involved in cell wall biosynthesis